MNLENFAKSFTKYFVPGLVLLVLGLILQLSLTDLLSLDVLKILLNPTCIIAGSILAGYLLDAIRGYRWTFHLKIYLAKRKLLANDIREISTEYLDESENNPDESLANLWLNEKDTYDRIFVERAEWVMVMETAFALIISAILFGFLLVFYWKFLEYRYTLLFLVCGLIALSFLASSNGIARMDAHNKKLIVALKKIHQQNTNQIDS